jgi:metal-responsive CopG/Arc/MetJ family transcriptional regulator
MPKGKRAPDQCQVSFTLPKAVLAELDAAAGAENRNRSNFIVTVLKEWLASHKKAQGGEKSRAA